LVIGADKPFCIRALNGGDGVLVDGRVKRGHDGDGNVINS